MVALYIVNICFKARFNLSSFFLHFFLSIPFKYKSIQRQPEPVPVKTGISLVTPQTPLPMRPAERLLKQQGPLYQEREYTLLTLTHACLRLWTTSEWLSPHCNVNKQTKKAKQNKKPGWIVKILRHATHGEARRPRRASLHLHEPGQPPKGGPSVRPGEPRSPCAVRVRPLQQIPEQFSLLVSALWCIELSPCSQ